MRCKTWGASVWARLGKMETGVASHSCSSSLQSAGIFAGEPGRIDGTVTDQTGGAIWAPR